MNALQYAEELVAIESVSRWSNLAAADYVEDKLRQLSFETERVEYLDENQERKVSVCGKRGDGIGGLAYFGHNDVVPADDWILDHGPFEPRQRDGKLYGRGSCDMKGSVAAMLAAAAETKDSDLAAPLYFVCTADEEIGYGGAKAVVQNSKYYREMVEHQTKAIIGEPTMLQVVYAHKGTYGFIATARGRAAHSSTSYGVNANLAMIPFLQDMKQIHDDTRTDARWLNDEFDPPFISWNIGINDHTRAVNITPPQSVCTVYFRPMPGQDPEQLMDRAERLAQEHGLEWFRKPCNDPMYSAPDSPFVAEMVRLTDSSPASTVPYGTDGSCFGELQDKVVFGPGDIAQAHTHDEWITLEQLSTGTEMFVRLINHWCR